MKKDRVDLGDERKIESLIDVSLDKIRGLIDVNCVIGNPISMPDGSQIIPNCFCLIFQNRL